MPFPEVKACLVGEFIRGELGGKFSMLGVYGITPHVSLQSTAPLSPMPIAFLIFCELPDQKQTGRTIELAVEPNVLGKSPMTVDLDPAKTPVIGIGLPAAQFPALGKYELVLYVDNAVHFRGGFSIGEVRAAVARA